MNIKDLPEKCFEILAIERAITYPDAASLKPFLKKFLKNKRQFVRRDKNHSDIFDLIIDELAKDSILNEKLDALSFQIIIELSDIIMEQSEAKNKSEEKERQLRAYFRGSEYKERVKALSAKIRGEGTTIFDNQDHFSQSNNYFIGRTKFNQSHFKGNVFIERASFFKPKKYPKIRFYKQLEDQLTGYLEFDQKSKSFTSVGEGMLYLSSPAKCSRIRVFNDRKSFFESLKAAAGNDYSKTVSYVLLEGLTENETEQYELSKLRERAKKSNLELEINTLS